MQLIREEYQSALQPETNTTTADNTTAGWRLHGAAGATATTGNGTSSGHAQHQYATTSSMFTLFGNDLATAMRVGADKADLTSDDDEHTDDNDEALAYNILL
jgi:hypothetical protein